jgi:hypothetical protein
MLFDLSLEILMPRPQDLAPTYDQVIEKILREASAPMPVWELAQKISAERPSTSKDPVKAAEKKIKEAVGRQLVYLDSSTIVPLQIAWQGARFRMDLSREEVNKGFFDVSIALSFYLPNEFDLTNLRLVDVDGQAIKFKVNAVHKKVKGLFGTSEQTFYYCHIPEWLRAHEFAPKDHLLFSILDRENGILKLEHEPHKQLNAKLLESRNRLLADILYDSLTKLRLKPTSQGVVRGLKHYAKGSEECILRAGGLADDDDSGTLARACVVGPGVCGSGIPERLHSEIADVGGIGVFSGAPAWSSDCLAGPAGGDHAKLCWASRSFCKARRYTDRAF